MNYKVVDMEKYYRRGVYRHFTEDCKCSTSITSKIDVSKLIEYSKKTNTKFYINFLYILAKVLNSREDYRMQYLYDKQQLIVFDKINPANYIFHEDTETCTVVYTEYFEEYEKFYNSCVAEIGKAKKTREYGLDPENHPNYFDASYISWLSYESLNIELPDGYLYFLPIINWGKYREENGKFLMPVSVRLNHAVADGYLNAKVFMLLEKEINSLSLSS
nr:CatA-like O-acetyltransferase, family 3 [Clostridium neonatale]